MTPRIYQVDEGAGGISREALQYASIVEVWMASQRPAADGSFDHDEPLPSERPENERDDAVMISTFERNGAFSLTTFIAKQQSKLLGARVDHESSGLGLGQWSGRMFNLFSHGRKLAVALVSKERSA